MRRMASARGVSFFSAALYVFTRIADQRLMSTLPLQVSSRAGGGGGGAAGAGAAAAVGACSFAGRLSPPRPQDVNVTARSRVKTATGRGVTPTGYDVRHVSYSGATAHGRTAALIRMFDVESYVCRSSPSASTRPSSIAPN